MRIIGITGGIGSGKTAVLNILRDEYGAFVMEADALAHKLMEPGEVSYNDIVKVFGTEVLKADGTIDRKLLGDIVFSDKDKLELLNSITHPNVKNAIIRSIEEQKQSGTAIYVIEAALLIQDGYKSICHEIWYVYADIDVRIDRLIKYRGFTKERALCVINNQESEDYYKRNCSNILDNSGDIGQLRIQINNVI